MSTGISALLISLLGIIIFCIELLIIGIWLRSKNLNYAIVFDKWFASNYYSIDAVDGFFASLFIFGMFVPILNLFLGVWFSLTVVMRGYELWRRNR